MTQATMTRPDTPGRTSIPFSLVAVVVVGAIICVAMAFALRDPDVVPRVTVVNPSTVDVNVRVHPADDPSSLILATVSGGTSAANIDVLEQGDEWVFDFSAGGVDGGSVRMSRAHVAREGWRVEIPDDVIARLQSGSFVPAYR
jgi:hypothetical protein